MKATTIELLTADMGSDPVLLCNDLGVEQKIEGKSSVIESCGQGSFSVKEAVRIAQSNNLMGLICNSRLLVRGSLLLSMVELISKLGDDPFVGRVYQSSRISPRHRYIQRTTLEAAERSTVVVPYARWR